MSFLLWQILFCFRPNIKENQQYLEEKYEKIVAEFDRIWILAGRTPPSLLYLCILGTKQEKVIPPRDMVFISTCFMDIEPLAGFGVTSPE